MVTKAQKQVEGSIATVHDPMNKTISVLHFIDFCLDLTEGGGK